MATGRIFKSLKDTSPSYLLLHTAIDKGMHGHKRRVISQGLSDECIKSFEATYLVHLRRFMNKILGENTVVDSEGWTEAINMTPICMFHIPKT
jgi:hypothetical protein